MRFDDEDRIKIQTNCKLPDKTILSYWGVGGRGGRKSALLLHRLARKASVNKKINIRIISHLMFSIAEGPVGAHRRAAAQHSQKCQIVGQVVRLERLQAPPCAAMDCSAGGDGSDSPWRKGQIAAEGFFTGST